MTWRLATAVVVVISSTKKQQADTALKAKNRTFLAFNV